MSFVINSAYHWPVPVDVEIYKQNGGMVGDLIFSNNYSSFDSDIPINSNFDLVTVGLGSKLLFDANEHYLIFVNHPDGLAVPAFDGVGDGVAVLYAAPDHLTGDPIGAIINYGSGPVGDMGLVLDGTAGVPEPGTWALLILGFGICGARVRQMKRSKSEMVCTAAGA